MTFVYGCVEPQSWFADPKCEGEGVAAPIFAYPDAPTPTARILNCFYAPLRMFGITTAPQSLGAVAITNLFGHDDHQS